MSPQKFGNNFQKTASLIFLVTRVLADGVRFLATAVIIQVITGWSLFFCCPCHRNGYNDLHSFWRFENGHMD